MIVFNTFFNGPAKSITLKFKTNANKAKKKQRFWMEYTHIPLVLWKSTWRRMIMSERRREKKEVCTQNSSHVHTNRNLTHAKIGATIRTNFEYDEFVVRNSTIDGTALNFYQISNVKCDIFVLFHQISDAARTVQSYRLMFRWLLDWKPMQIDEFINFKINFSKTNIIW